ncbi:unnamed protein product, partial [Symbiodinium sp. KB8]
MESLYLDKLYQNMPLIKLIQKLLGPDSPPVVEALYRRAQARFELKQRQGALDDVEKDFLRILIHPAVWVKADHHLTRRQLPNGSGQGASMAAIRRVLLTPAFFQTFWNFCS